MLPAIGGLEAIREGIKDAKYIATLKGLIAENPSDPNAIDANDYLDDLYNTIDPNYKTAYSDKTTDIGYYKAILSDINDPNDFDAFTDIRKDIADHIEALQ